MKRRTKIISAVMALAILVCVFAVLATSFAVDTSSESASFRVDAQIMGYNRVEVKIYAPAGAAGGSYTLKYDSKYMSLDKPKENEKGEQTSVTSYENGGTAITNYNFSQDSLRCSAAAPKSSSTEQLYGSYTFKFDGNYKEGSISVTAFDIYSGDETPKLLGSDKTAKCDFDVKEAPANTISLKYIGDKYYYMVSGKNDTSYSGLVNYYGTYYYVENGVLNWDYSGLTKYYGTWYYVENSELKWNYTGLTKYYGTWYYVEKGVLNWNYTGLTKYYDTWYYVKEGVLDWSYTGLTKYYGTWYYVYGGILRWDTNTLVKYGDDWYVVSGGVVDFGYNGAYVYGDTLNAIDGGVWNKNYNGPIYYDGNAYTLTNGTLYSYYLHPQAVNHNAPYLIAVDRTNNCITVYAKDNSGKFTVPDRAFVCSVGTDGLTPVGVFNTPAKYRWKELRGNVHGQYSTRIVGKVLFHSVPYSKQDNSTLLYRSYNKLGSAASHGCVRLTTADAKWIYDCCPLGTTVMIYDSWGGTVLPKPSAVKISASDGRRGWDPTDPDPANPWRR